MTLAADFYERPVVEVARDLVGCVVLHRGLAGTIVETEAYHQSEPACHAYAGLTPRTRVLFGPPGRAYVYRSYGVHALLNAVCEADGVGAAVLIRALEPLRGISAMHERRERLARRRSSNGPFGVEELCSGPGRLTQAFGIELAENGTSLQSGPVTIVARPADAPAPVLACGPRVGITRAVDLPWRFCVADNRHVSRPWGGLTRLG